VADNTNLPSGGLTAGISLQQQQLAKLPALQMADPSVYQ
jgi:hypothetical protein